MDCQSKCQHLTISKKSTKTFELQFTKNGVATDITGWTIYMTVKQNISDSDTNAVIDKVITSHTNATAGKTQIDLTTSDTDLTGSYYYSIDFKDNENNEDVLFYGRINFVDSVRDTRN